MKKISVKMIVAIVVILYINSISAQKTASINESCDLLNIAVNDFQIQNKNMHLALSEIAYKYNVPIGLEVSPNDDLLNENKNITIEIKKGTIKDIFDSVVNQNSLYTWEIRNDVVNVFPKENHRDSLLKQLMETRIESFYIAERASRFGLREALTKREEVKNLLKTENILVENEVFSSHGIRVLGKNFSLEISNVTLIELLNRIIKNSETKYWIVNRYGENRQYLLLNL